MKDELRGQTQGSETPSPPKIGFSRKLLPLSRLEGQTEKLMFPEPSGQGHVEDDGTRQAYVVSETPSQRRERGQPECFSPLPVISDLCLPGSNPASAFSAAAWAMQPSGVLLSDTEKSRRKVRNGFEYKQYTPWRCHHGACYSVKELMIHWRKPSSY